jgi:hypothetical protein
MWRSMVSRILNPILGNRDKSEPFGRLTSNSRPRVVFIHIPKCAGTTLRLQLAKQFPLGLIAAPGLEGAGVRPTTPEEAANFNHYDLIMGHLRLQEAERFFPEHSLITVFRDPIERIQSSYAYSNALPASKIAPDDRISKLMRELTFSEFIRLESAEVSITLNLMTHYLVNDDIAPSGPEAAKAAIEALERLSAVGLADSFQETLLLMCDRFDWLPDGDMAWLNPTLGPDGHPPLNNDDVEVLHRRMLADQRLFDAAKERFRRDLQDLHDRYDVVAADHDLSPKLSSLIGDRVLAGMNHDGDADAIARVPEQEVYGSGWSTRDGSFLVAPLTSGPSILMPVAGADKARKVLVCGEFSSIVPKAMKMVVNGVPVETKVTVNGDRSFIAEAHLTAPVMRAGHPRLVSVAFSIDEPNEAAGGLILVRRWEISKRS